MACTYLIFKSHFYAVALAYEMKIMLQTFIQVDRYFDLELLNEKITNFEYGYCEATNKPTHIPCHTNWRSKQSETKW